MVDEPPPLDVDTLEMSAPPAAPPAAAEARAEGGGGGASRRRARSPEPAAAAQPPAKRPREQRAPPPEELSSQVGSPIADSDDHHAAAAAAVPSGGGGGQEARAVLVMVGIPGAGKSTFVEQLIASCGAVCWSRFCQDELGNRDKVLQAARKALRGDAVNPGGVSVVIDRTDFDAAQRAHWVQLAREEGAQALALTLLPEGSGPEGYRLCLQRAQQRPDHPSDANQPGGAPWDRICKTFHGKLSRSPVDAAAEGFAWSHVVDGSVLGGEDAMGRELDRVRTVLKDHSAPDAIAAALAAPAVPARSQPAPTARDQPAPAAYDGGGQPEPRRAVAPAAAAGPSAQRASPPVPVPSGGVFDWGAAVDAAWHSRWEWGPQGWEASTERGTGGTDAPSLWAALVTQRVQRQGRGCGGAEQWGEVQVRSQPQRRQQSQVAHARGVELSS